MQFGEKRDVPRVTLGEGLVGYAALHREPVLVADVSQDPRYIKVVPDVRSELAIPMLLKDRCIGVVDLESPELDAFTKRDVEILTLLASQAAVAIENARLYEELRANEARLEKEVRFAQRVQIALLPTEPPKRLKGVEVAAAFAPARELGGDFHDYLAPESNTLVVARRRRLGQGRARGALQRLRRRARARPHLPPPLSAGAIEPGERAVVDQHDPAPASARGVLLHALLRDLRSEAAHDDAGQLGPAVSDPLLRRRAARRSSCRACRSGSFPGSTYDEVTFALHPGDIYVFCTDGVFEAMNEHGQEFTATRLLEVVGTIARAAGGEDRRRDLRGRRRMARRCAAERRHDGGRSVRITA